MTYRHMIQREVICCFHRSQKVRRIHFHGRKTFCRFGRWRQLSSLVLRRKKRSSYLDKKTNKHKTVFETKRGTGKKCHTMGTCSRKYEEVSLSLARKAYFCRPKKQLEMAINVSNDPLFLVFFHLKCKKINFPPKIYNIQNTLRDKMKELSWFQIDLQNIQKIWTYIERLCMVQVKKSKFLIDLMSFRCNITIY